VAKLYFSISVLSLLYIFRRGYYKINYVIEIK